MPSMEHEKQLADSGFACIAGVDEAGRGPLAGPVSVAAVVLPADFEHAVLNDSKQISESRRESLFEELTGDDRIAWHCILMGVGEIDQMNILQATWEGMRRSVAGLPVKVDAALIDGKPVREFPVHQVALVKGDSRSFSIAAASIIAKVTRDRYMRELAGRFPEYGFEKHKGYRTARHLEALREHGPCPEHRRSFSPVAQLELEL
jgi:ribonuclease HII